MKYLAIILLTLAINAQAGNKTYCGPDSIICRYESLYTQFDQISRYASGNKSIIWALLYEHTTGQFFTKMNKYIGSMDSQSFDGTLVFLDPAAKVVSTKVLVDTKTKKIIKRVLRENHFIVVDEKETVSDLILIYTLTNDSGKWKICDIVPGTI